MQARESIGRFDRPARVHSAHHAHPTQTLPALAGAERSWAGELPLTGGRPLVEADPDRLDAAFGVTAELA